jgi:hypothetical protein
MDKHETIVKCLRKTSTEVFGVVVGFVGVGLGVLIGMGLG